MDTRIYAPALGLQTWKSRLADPEKQWVRKKSAFETAVFWEVGARQSRGLHTNLADLLDQEELLRNSELIASFPEHRVKLPGGHTASQSDVWAILRSEAGLISLVVEGKAGETFAATVGEWRRDASSGKQERLAFLCQRLGIQGQISDSVRYQLLHRAASAVIEAERIGAIAAVMAVVSFATDPLSKSDYEAFATCIGCDGAADRLWRASTSSIPLFIGWLDASPCTDVDIAGVSL